MALTHSKRDALSDILTNIRQTRERLCVAQRALQSVADKSDAPDLPVEAVSS